jgi:non-homologous end joining protein Ku
LQIGPEIPGFISRYVASIKEQVAGLISYHVAESVFAKWAEILDRMIDSAEIRFDPKAFDEIVKSRSLSLLSSKPAARVAPKAPVAEAPAEQPASDSSDLYMKIAGGALIAIVVGIIIYRKKKGLS